GTTVPLSQGGQKVSPPCKGGEPPGAKRGGRGSIRMNPPAVHFSHVGIFVRDIARMERFYTEFLGLVASDAGDLKTNTGTVRMVFLSRNPLDHHQIVLCEGRPPDAAFSVINQISLRVEDVAALRYFHSNAAA